jgi:hypothetical protein
MPADSPASLFKPLSIQLEGDPSHEVHLSALTGVRLIDQAVPLAYGAEPYDVIMNTVRPRK